MPFVPLILLFGQIVVGHAVVRAEQIQAASSEANVVAYHGYEDCIELTNGTTRVVLCPAVGGRVLEYSLNGTNVLYLPKGDEGWQPEPNQRYKEMPAGRFDIGPEKIRKRSNDLWWGRWSGKITGRRKALLTSRADEVSGAKLRRSFELDVKTSKLTCTQTIENISDRTIGLCHWSRTFAVGGGIAIVPRSTQMYLRRFPLGWVMYGEQNSIRFRPSDPNVRVTDEAVIVSGPTENAKLGFDSFEGQLAYLAPNDLLFVKSFNTFPDRSYNEVAGLTISVWYPAKPMVELEPIGPAEVIEPGGKASFTETWFLHDYPFPTRPDDVRWSEIQKSLSLNSNRQSESSR